MQKIEVRTRRLVLVPQTEAEITQRLEAERDPEMRKAYGDMLRTMCALPGREEWGSDWKICLADGTCVGGIGFKGTPDERGDVEIGYGIDEPFRRCGYATEAVAGLTDWALAQPGVRRALAQTEPDNAISQRVLVKNGFARCGDGEEGPLFARR